MNKISESLKNWLDSVSVRHAAQFCGITMFSCAAVLCAFASYSRVNEKEVTDGQGGLETPGMPVVTEEVIENLTEEISVDEDKEVTYFSYRVKKGDMISVIADRYNVTQDTIISVNNIRSSRLLQIGTYLKIPSKPGIIYTVRKDGETLTTIAEKYNVDVEKCAFVNNMSKEDSLSAGTMLFIEDAKLDWVTRQEINGDLFKKPIKGWWYKSSSFGYRSSPFTGARSWHSGVDMASKQGTLIYAALPGTVTYAGYNNTYGYHVIIKHHSGYSTLYGHMSEMLVKKGQFVTHDSKIGRVGSTGLSTGPHLHFTVMKNGNPVNPVKLWN